MLSRPVVPVLLGQSEVDEEQLVTVTADSHEEVVWFNVSVDEVFVVDIPREQIVLLVSNPYLENTMILLDSADHLICKHEDSLHGESSGAEVEEILQTGSEQIHDEDVVVPLLAVPPDVRDPPPALQDFVQLALVQELGVAGLHTLQLNSHLKLCIM